MPVESVLLHSALDWQQRVNQSVPVQYHHPATVVITTHCEQQRVAKCQKTRGKHDVVDCLVRPAVVLI